MQTRLERQLRRLNQRVATLELGNVRPGPEAGASAVSGKSPVDPAPLKS